MKYETDDIVRWMDAVSRQSAMKNTAMFGVTAKNVYGIKIPVLAAKAREIGRDHELALRLWDTAIHDARLLATMIADPKQVTPELMDRLAGDFDSWDICDQCCVRLFRNNPAARQKIYEWAPREEEFVRRAAFALIATMAVADKKSPDGAFEPYLDLIIKYSTDDRNFVRKAVNWALRQIGKRSPYLYNKAGEVAARLAESDDKTARWIGKDALREFSSPKVNVRVDGKVVKARSRRRPAGAATEAGKPGDGEYGRRTTSEEENPNG